MDVVGENQKEIPRFKSMCKLGSTGEVKAQCQAFVSGWSSIKTK